MKRLSEGRASRRRQPDITARRTASGLSRLVDAVTPWLLDLSSWIFGALIAFNLVILGALLTVGPVDPAVKISTLSFALALPLDVAGFLLLRLVGDLSKGGVADLAADAFEKEGFVREGPAPSRELVEKRLQGATLRYSYLVLGVALVLTVAGVTAALWHMAWWIGAAFVVMAFVSQGVIFLVVMSLDTSERWRSPTGEVEPPKPG
jgi:hypothetical protein